MENPDANEEVPPRRLPYHTPTLVVFGSLADLTATIGTMSKLDGGMAMMNRSQP